MCRCLPPTLACRKRVATILRERMRGAREVDERAPWRDGHDETQMTAQLCWDRGNHRLHEDVKKKV